MARQAGHALCNAPPTLQPPTTTGWQEWSRGYSADADADADAAAQGQQAPVQVCKQGRKMLERVQGRKKKPDREARETRGTLYALPHPVSPPKTL